MRALTRTRIILAFAIALATDGVQVLLGPVGWTFFDEGMDLAAMVLISWAIGFHPLLLPTFVVEFFPIVDMAPTWTVCTAIVVSLRRKAATSAATAAQDSEPTEETGAPVYSETGVREPPPLREPKSVHGSDRSIG